MSKYLEVTNSGNLNTDEVLRKMKPHFNPANPDLVNKYGPSFSTRIIPEVRLEDPVVDGVTERHGRLTDTIEAYRVTRIKSVVPISQEEQDERTESQIVRNKISKLQAGTTTRQEERRIMIWLLRKVGGGAP